MNRTCPLCQSQAIETFHDYGRFLLLSCKSCGLVFQPLDRVNPFELVTEVYNDSWVAMRNEYAASTFYEHAVFNNLVLEMYKPQKGTLLEIGSGTGEFLYTAREAGWSVAGIEGSQVSCQYAHDQYGIEITQGMWDKSLIPADVRFDAVVFWHVLEHIPNPVSFLADVSSVLQPDGLLFFSIPNNDSLTNQIYRENSPLYTEVDHLYHYNARNLQLLAEQADLEILHLFSRQNPHEFTNRGASMTLTEKIKMMSRAQANGQGHELFCIARPKRAGVSQRGRV